MKNFFKTIWGSFYSSDLYKKAKEERASRGIKFILKTCLFLGLFLGIIMLVIFLIFSGILKKLAVNFVEKSYPDQLIVTVKDGNLTTNTSEPVIIPLPAKEQKENSPKNLTVLVPLEKAEPSLLEKYSTMSAITSNGIISMKNGKDSGEFETYTFKNANRVVTKASAIESSYFLLNILKIIIAIMIIPSMIIMLLSLSFGHVIFLFFVALLIYLIMKMKKINTTYKQSFKMGLYTIVPLLILEIITFPFHLSGLLFTIVVILGIILYSTHTWGTETSAKNTETVNPEINKEENPNL